MTEFRLETGLPVWHYQVGEIVLEKRVLLPHQQNTVYVIYRLLEGPDCIRLKLLPSVQFRSHDGPVSTPLPKGFRLFSEEGRHELSAGPELPTLRMKLFGQRPAFTSEPQQLTQLLYRMEESRGYDSQGDLWSPGYFRVDLVRGENVALVASTEVLGDHPGPDPGRRARAETQRRARLLGSCAAVTHSSLASELVLAADQFIIVPTGRVQDAARVQAAGDEVADRHRRLSLVHGLGS